MQAEIKDRTFKEIEHFFPRRKMFQWDEIITIGILAGGCIALTIYYFNLTNNAGMLEIIYQIIKGPIILLDVILQYCFL